MKNKTVKLLSITPLSVAVTAVRGCWDSFDKSDSGNYVCSICGDEMTSGEMEDLILGTQDSFDAHMYCQCGGRFTYVEVGEKDKALVDRVANKYMHSSTIEHIVVSFRIEGISRALLQELARHRIASLSVKSTRYTLKELKHDPMVGDEDGSTIPWAIKYVVFTGNPYVDGASIDALNRLQKLLAKGISNDVAKYALPESYRTSLTYTINFRSFMNLLGLRTDKSALKEFRELARLMFEQIPDEYKYLLEPYVKEEK